MVTPPSDPEFTPQGPGEPGDLPRPDAEAVRFYQRFVANPFLSVVVFTLGYSLSKWMIRHDWPQTLTIGSILATVLGPFFFLQYHCVDCGGSGRFRWREHACRPVRERWARGDLGATGWPSPSRQLAAWLLVALVLGLFAWTRSGAAPPERIGGGPAGVRGR